MKLSMLRPREGWRAFAGEVGVVVLGVLLALGAQEIAETVDDRSEAAATRESLANEIEESLAVLELRKAAQPCIDRRLTELRAIVGIFCSAVKRRNESRISRHHLTEKL